MSKKRKTQVLESSFADLYECVICQEKTTFPVGMSHSCKHAMCQTCLLKLSTRSLYFHRPPDQPQNQWHYDSKKTCCPSCRSGNLSPFGGSELRILDRCIYKILNNGVDMLSCRFQCGFHKETDLTLAHEFICWKRPFPCPYPDCDETFTLESYRHYMETIVNEQKQLGKEKTTFIVKSLDPEHSDWLTIPKAHYQQYMLIILSRAALHHFQSHGCKHRVPCDACQETFSIAEMKHHADIHTDVARQLASFHLKSYQLSLTPEVMTHLSALQTIWSKPKLSSMVREELPEASPSVILCPRPSLSVHALPPLAFHGSMHTNISID